MPPEMFKICPTEVVVIITVWCNQAWNEKYYQKIMIYRERHFYIKKARHTILIITDYYRLIATYVKYF